ncbi:MAG: CheR family methyltransferase [Moraxella sp.]|nr:CheR family methyltransferase [Moraxella sp.]
MNANHIKDLSPWLAFIEARIGFVLPKTQHGWLTNAINSTCARYNITAQTLLERVRFDTEARQVLLDAILITETRFFRHKPSIDFVVQQYQKHAQHSEDNFVVLSAGCSEGHEVWSLAMALHQSAATPHYRLLGLDASYQALAVAKQAQYPLREFDTLPDDYYYSVKSEIQQGYFEPIAVLRDCVDFVWCNLFDDSLAQSLLTKGVTKADVIVCQNVLIYFRRFDQRDILARLVDRLHVGGYLILAGGEALFWQHDEMRRLSHASVNVWQKIAK